MFKIKPCPFCGSEKVYLTGNKKYWVVCGKCGAEGPTLHVLWDYKGPAIKAWNTRAGDQQ